MFGMNILQAILIILFAGLMGADVMGPQHFLFWRSPVGQCLITAAILGNPAAGLPVGASLALMSLGVVGLGGASVPNYRITSIVTTIVVVASNQPFEVGLAIGLPVGMMNVYLDVMIKTIGATLATNAQKDFEQHNFAKGYNTALVILAMNIGQYVLPVALVIFAGQPVVEALVNIIPDWLYNGLKVAGKILPVTGMAMLLNYMPVKKHWQYLVLGFVLFSYLKLAILPIGVIGLVIAVCYYKRELGLQKLTAGAVVGGDMEDE